MSALSDEIMQDPAGRGYATPLAAGDNAGVLALLNEPITDQVGAHVVSSAELLIWGGQAGRLAALTAAETDTSLTADQRAIAQAARLMVQRADTVLDYSRAEIQGMVAALVQAGVFTPSDKTSLETLATAKVSRAEQVIGWPATLDDVRGTV